MPRHYTRRATTHPRHVTRHSSDEGGTATLDRREEFTERRNTGMNRPLSDKIQPYDHVKGFDESKYDLRKGEIGNPAVPNPHKLATPPAPFNQSTGLCIECGKGVAPAQNYVCRDHMRAG